MVTAPWYAWRASDGSPRAGVPRFGRGSAPSIQKFASDDFVNDFLKDAQRSLVFDPDIDQVYAVNLIPASAGQFAGKLAALFPIKADGTPWRKGDPTADLRKSQLLPTGLRKIYLPTHARNYLLTAELHCDVAGFPPVDDDDVCQAGFVVRRRRIDIPKEARPEAQKLIASLIAAQQKLGDLDQTTPLRPHATKNRAARIAKLKAAGAFEGERAKAEQAVTAARQALDEWQATNGVRSVSEGWIPSTHKGIGSWQPVEDTPQTLTEAWFPMYRLFADPTVPAHDAAGRAFYFGVLPTLEADMTERGEPRFDDHTTYEVRCFFRHHDCRCPRRGLNIGAPDCDGELTWSEPTQPYRLASQFDLLGTANRPVTIQMPNLAELAAQALARPAGRFSPVRVVQPQSLHPQTDGKGATGGAMGGGQICFFAIPLITIIAFFVLNLFLPIVVFLFGLWFLLALKLCILPSFDFAGGLQAELALIPPKVGVDAGFEVDVDAPGFQVTVGGSVKNGVQVHTELVGELAHAIAEMQGFPRKINGIANPLHDPRAAAIRPDIDRYANAPLIGLAGAFYEQGQKRDLAEAEGGILDLASGLKYEPKRISQWKHEKHLPTTGEYA
jgi:hypothetical protein